VSQLDAIPLYDFGMVCHARGSYLSSRFYCTLKVLHKISARLTSCSYIITLTPGVHTSSYFPHGSIDYHSTPTYLYIILNHCIAPTGSYIIIHIKYHLCTHPCRLDGNSTLLYPCFYLGPELTRQVPLTLPCLIFHHAQLGLG
jgi:hypothetical protein